MMPMLILAWAVSGQASAAIADELTRIEQRLASTWLSGDCAAWGAMLAPDWSVIHITGETMTRPAALAACKAGPGLETLRADDLAVRVYGDTAIVTGRTTAITSGATPITVTLRFTDVFIRRDGRWLAVASHATRLEPPP
jgi:hypothetical protein